MIEILFEDPWFLVIQKPFGLQTQAIAGIPSVQSMLEEQLLRRQNNGTHPFIGVPHRLDRVTTGVMVFARNQRALSRLSEQFASRVTRKIYHAVVAGTLPSSGEWNDRIRKIENVAKAEIVAEGDPDGREALLTFQTLRSGIRYRNRSVSHVEIALHSGRMHQIRIQFASRGHPLVGDALYGSELQWGDGQQVGGDGNRESPVALHSFELGFRHPKTAEWMSFRAGYPASWDFLRNGE